MSEDQSVPSLQVYAVSHGLFSLVMGFGFKKMVCLVWLWVSVLRRWFEDCVVGFSG